MVIELMFYLGKSTFYSNNVGCQPNCNNPLQAKINNNILEKSPVKDIVAFGAKAKEKHWCLMRTNIAAY